MAKSRPAAPPEIADIVECIGDDNAVRLLELRGGTRIHVPHPANVRTSWLAEHFDAGALTRLASSFGGNTINLPICREWRARLYLHEGGRSHSEIALKCGATVNWVQRLASTDWVPLPRAHRGMRKVAAEKAQLSFDIS